MVLVVNGGLPTGLDAVGNKAVPLDQLLVGGRIEPARVPSEANR